MRLRRVRPHGIDLQPSPSSGFFPFRPRHACRTPYVPTSHGDSAGQQCPRGTAPERQVAREVASSYRATASAHLVLTLAVPVDLELIILVLPVVLDLQLNGRR